MIWKTLPVPTLLKVDAGQRTIAGIITAPLVDMDGEICDTQGSWPYYEERRSKMSAASDGKNFLPLREMHGLSAAGKCTDLKLRSDGSIYGVFEVVDDGALDKCSQGVYTGLSQAGRMVRRWEEDGKVLYIIDPIECSLVDVPALDVCTFAYVKANGSMELRKFKKGIQMNAEHFLTAAKHHDDLAGINSKLAADHSECSRLHKTHAEHLRKMAAGAADDPLDRLREPAFRAARVDLSKTSPNDLW